MEYLPNKDSRWVERATRTTWTVLHTPLDTNKNQWVVAQHRDVIRVFTFTEFLYNFYPDQVAPTSVYDLARQCRITLPNAHNWRLIRPALTGQIHGLDNFHGNALATDGVEVLIERPNHTIVFGHLQFFVPDKALPPDFYKELLKVEQCKKSRKSKKTAPAPAPTKKLIAEYQQLMH